jgi:hypothetical protein
MLKTSSYAINLAKFLDDLLNCIYFVHRIYTELISAVGILRSATYNI